MAKTDNLTDFLTGVANAIRTKKGTTAKINPQNFETEIGSITTSKPEQEKTVTPTNAQKIVLPDSGKTLSKVIIKSAPLPDWNNSSYSDINGCLIVRSTKTLLLGCNDSVIPSDGSVTSIGDSAFYGCRGLTSITIPDSVTDIGWNAFFDCEFTSVTIPNSVTSIDRYAFASCSELTSIVIPDSVTSIGSTAFSGCDGIESLVVTTGNKKYHSANNCIIETETKNLIIGCKTSIIPSDGSVTSIGDSAFSNCSKLTSIIIPDNVASIGDSAFSSCYGLTSVTIGNGVTSIGMSAFYRCEGLTSITIPDSVTSIGEMAFDNCSGLTSVTIGNGVTYIGHYAFYKCSGLTSVIIPDSVTSINESVFRYCAGLTSVTIGKGVTSIGMYAFDNCSGLTSVIVLSTTPPKLEKDVFAVTAIETITVPVGCGEAYKAANGWSAYADKIVEAAA